MSSKPANCEKLTCNQCADEDQLDFDFTEPSKIDKMVDLLEKQNLILKEISLKLDNGKKVKINKQR